MICNMFPNNLENIIFYKNIIQSLPPLSAGHVVADLLIPMVRCTPRSNDRRYAKDVDISWRRTRAVRGRKYWPICDWWKPASKTLRRILTAKSSTRSETAFRPTLSRTTCPSSATSEHYGQGPSLDAAVAVETNQKVCRPICR